MSYRKGHIAAAAWSIRPRLTSNVPGGSALVVLIAEENGVAELAARDLRAAGVAEVRRLTGGPANWAAAGLDVVATPDSPSDAECIDHLFFTQGRNQGDAEAARQYLAWEIALVDRLDDQERGAFRIAVGPSTPLSPSGLTRGSSRPTRPRS